MLMKRLGVIALLAILSLLSVVPAGAAGRVDPPPAGSAAGSKTGVDMWIGIPGSGGGGGGGGSAVTDPGCHSADGTSIPCSTAAGSWYGGGQCYLTGVSDTAGSGAWTDNRTGYSYVCTGLDGGTVVLILPSPVAPPPDAAVLAQEAVAHMGLKAVEIGIVPPPGPDRMGVIGVPVWMWAADPGPSTTGPNTATASAGGYSVTAVASVSHIEWSMGDGTVVSCGPGTAWTPADGMSPSPTCGHVYQQQGVFTVTATSFWVIEWVGIGQHGTLTMQFSDSVSITEGELQVVVTGK